MTEKIQNENPEAVRLPILYSRKQAAKALSISVRKLTQLISAGKLAVTRIDGKVLISSWELLAFIEARTMRKGNREVM
jgi:excisionase family DNA binding protein